MEHHVRVATMLANLLDNKFSLFGTRFGLNGILGLIPGAGDIITTVLSLHLIWIAFQLHLPLHKIVLMLWNVLVNFVIGLVPVIGDYVDFFNHANLKNLAIIREHISAKKVVEGHIID